MCDCAECMMREADELRNKRDERKPFSERRKQCSFQFRDFGMRNCELPSGHKGKHRLKVAHRSAVEEPLDEYYASLAERPASGSTSELAAYGHHPDPLIDAQIEIDRLEGLLTEAHGGLLRALDYRAATPEGLSIKADVRDALMRTGCSPERWGRTAMPEPTKGQNACAFSMCIYVAEPGSKYCLAHRPSGEAYDKKTELADLGSTDSVTGSAGSDVFDSRREIRRASGESDASDRLPSSRDGGSADSGSRPPQESTPETDHLLNEFARYCVNYGLSGSETILKSEVVRFIRWLQNQ